MGIFDAFKGFIGWPTNRPTNSDVTQFPQLNEFIKPDWANDDAYSSDEDLVYRNPQGNFSFNIFSNPLQIHQFFEHQMNEMARHFEKALSKRDGFLNDQEMRGMIDNFFSESSFLNQGLQNTPMIQQAPLDQNQSLRDKCFKPNSKQKQIIDSDIDNEFQNGQIKLLNPHRPVHLPYIPEDKQKVIGIYPEKYKKPQVHTSQVFIKFIQRPDGSTEEVRTKTDGDKRYTKVTFTDAHGQKHVQEDIVSIDEDKLPEFQRHFADTQFPNFGFKKWF